MLNFVASYFVLYFIPFFLICISWNFRSFFVIVGIVVGLLVFLRIRYLQVPLDDQNIEFALISAILTMTSFSAVVGTITRGFTLMMDWRYFSISNIATTIAALMAVPTVVVATLVYDQWERRPPSEICVAKRSFAVKTASGSLLVPNWPLVMVSSGSENFVLSLPAHLRRLCNETVDGQLEAADSVTFFFDHVTFRPQPNVKAWSERECRAPDPIIAPLVCGQRHVEELSIYGDVQFTRRTIGFGRVSSHAFFIEEHSKGRYPPTEARRHHAASEYPDGTWAFDDGSVFSCHQTSNGYPSCRGDFELAPKLLAKVYFNAWNGDVENAQRLARQAVTRLYSEVLKPTI